MKQETEVNSKIKEKDTSSGALKWLYVLSAVLAIVAVLLLIGQIQTYRRAKSLLDCSAYTTPDLVWYDHSVQQTEA